MYHHIISTFSIATIGLDWMSLVAVEAFEAFVAVETRGSGKQRSQASAIGLIMPKYFRDRIANHYLYFTSHCIVEAMHVHASDRRMTEYDSAKFYVMSDGSSKLMDVE